MNKIFFTSDLHLCHNQTFIYEPRGFNSVDEMNKTIIKNWNSIVDSGDTVYILGDIMLNDDDKGLELFNQLNGTKYIILGNHDSNNRIQKYITCETVDRAVFAHRVKKGKHLYFLCHYPTITGNYSDNDNWSKTTWCLCGHTHSKEKFQKEYPYTYNVALDAHDCAPVTIEEIEQDIRQWYNERK